MNASLTEKPIKEYSGVAGRVLKLIISGCTQVQAAGALGIDESYVSQLCGEIDFQTHVANAIKADIEQAIEIDRNYANIEKALSDRLKSMLPYMLNVDQILRTIKFVNDAKRKVAPVIPTHGGAGGVPTGTNGATIGTVQLVLPQVIVRQQVTFVTNPNNEVVSVDGKQLVTIDSKVMEAMAAEKKEKPKLPKTLRNDTQEDKWRNL